MNPLRVSIGAIRQDGLYFLQRRAPEARHFPGLWEFPGGKVEPGESPGEALLRELEEETGWAPERMESLPVLWYAYPGLRVELNPFLCEGPGAPGTELAWGWFSLAEMVHLPMPEGSRHVLPLLGRARGNAE